VFAGEDVAVVGQRIEEFPVKQIELTHIAEALLAG
jgi:hypothetical protein